MKLYVLLRFVDDICFGCVLGETKSPCAECQHIVPAFQKRIKVSHKHLDLRSYYVFSNVFQQSVFWVGFWGGFDPPEATDLTRPGFQYTQDIKIPHDI